MSMTPEEAIKVIQDRQAAKQLENHQRLVRESDELWQELETINSAKQRITVSELMKFEMHYKQNTPIPRGVNELKEFAASSDAFIKRIDPYSALTVTSDDGKQVLAVLPPAFNEVNTVTGDQSDVWSDYQLYSQNALPYYREMAATRLIGSVVQVQDLASIQAKREEFAKLDAAAKGVLVRGEKVTETTDPTKMEPAQPMDLVFEEDPDDD